MEIFLIILIAIAASYAAWRLGGLYARKLNNTLREQNSLLEKFSHYWFQNVLSTQDLSKNIAKEQTQNLQATIQSTLLLLNSLSKQTEQTNPQDSEKIKSIISTIKGISPES